MGYYEGELPLNTGSHSGFGGDGWWAIILFAMIFGWGRNGGYGMGSGGGGSEVLGYELGKVATTNDVANGFAQNTLQRGIDDILLGQANAINYNNQGFYGLNTAILTTGNTISREIADCCCATQRLIERGFCDVINNQNTNTQRVIDYMQNEKINSLQAENVALKGRISNNEQSAYIINSLNPQPRPSYIVPNPNCCYQTSCNTII
jgi:hypothetical protein